jgi:hypothetical protein
MPVVMVGACNFSRRRSDGIVGARRLSSIDHTDNISR